MSREKLPKIIYREYGISVVRLQPFHSLWKLTGPQGTFLLKEMPCPTERIIWLQQQLQLLHDAGFTGLVPFMPTLNGSPLFSQGKKHYVIIPWQPGSHPSFTNLNHLQRTARLWGELHHTAAGIATQDTVPGDDYPFANLQAQTAFLTATLHRLQSRSPGNRIDRTLWRWGNYFLAQAQTSLAQLERLGFDQWCRTTAAKGFCHNDPAPANIIMHNNNWYLIDFEHSASGIFLLELALLVRRVLRVNRWDPQLVEPLLTAYATDNCVSGEEARQFLPTLLGFPRPFWRLCRQRFHEKRNWSEKHYQSRLWEITNEEPLRAQFLQQWSGARPAGKLPEK
jgi:CotS family spore coat protein